MYLSVLLSIYPSIPPSQRKTKTKKERNYRSPKAVRFWPVARHTEGKGIFSLPSFPHICLRAIKAFRHPCHSICSSMPSLLIPPPPSPLFTYLHLRPSPAPPPSHGSPVGLPLNVSSLLFLLGWWWGEQRAWSPLLALHRLWKERERENSSVHCSCIDVKRPLLASIKQEEPLEPETVNWIRTECRTWGAFLAQAGRLRRAAVSPSSTLQALQGNGFIDKAVSRIIRRVVIGHLLAC